jgi:hypothetical protein
MKENSRHDKIWMASVLSAFHTGLGKNFQFITGKTSTEEYQMQEQNKHMHMDVSIKFEIKNLILSYESEARITDSVQYHVCRQVCFSSSYMQATSENA